MVHILIELRTPVRSKLREKSKRVYYPAEEADSVPMVMARKQAHFSGIYRTALEIAKRGDNVQFSRISEIAMDICSQGVGHSLLSVSQLIRGLCANNTQAYCSLLADGSMTVKRSQSGGQFLEECEGCLNIPGLPPLEYGDTLKPSPPDWYVNRNPIKDFEKIGRCVNEADAAVVNPLLRFGTSSD
ncbi:unnamed protein product [Calypogeia fissa]